MKRFSHRFISFLYLLIDVALLSAAFFIPAHQLGQAAAHFEKYTGIYAFWIMSVLLFCRFLNLYTTDRYLGAWREIRRVARAVTYATLLAAVFLFFFKLHFVSRTVMLLNYSLATTLLVTWRFLKRQVVRKLVIGGFNNKNVLIIGTGKSAVRYAQHFISNPHLGLRVVGFLEVTDRVKEKTILGRPVVGMLHDFQNVTQMYFVEHLVITVHNPREAIAGLLKIGKMLNLTMHMVPDYFDFDQSTVELKYIDEYPVIEYHELRPNYQMIVFKRLVDLFLSVSALIILFPIFLIISLWIKFEDGDPVFYASRRWGLKGRLFNCYKFRSMVVNAEKLQGELRSRNEMDGPVFKIKNDPRLTRIGKLLRRYSLDELPQIWNVVKGDMSIVGPRPLPENEQVGNYRLDYLRRLLIKPGLTCLWQVRGRSNVPFTKWMRWDVFYLKHWSLLLDLRIMFWTIPAVLKGRGAY